MTEHEKVSEFVAVRALGALYRYEARLVEAHLDICDECRAEARAMSKSAARRHVIACSGSSARITSPPLRTVLCRSLGSTVPIPARLGAFSVEPPYSVLTTDMPNCKWTEVADYSAAHAP